MTAPRRFHPSIPAIALVIWWVVASVVFPDRMLNADGDMLRHIGHGNWMLEHGRLIAEDPFSFTRGGQPFTGFEYGSQLILALVHNAGSAGAVLAMACWTAFGLLNARWLARHPEVNSIVWANWLGVAAGLGALGIWAVAGTDLATLAARPGFGTFVAVCAVTGIGAAWVASVLWNMASRRLSPSLAGQLIVSETVFGLIYSFAWDGAWPAALQWAACVLFVLGILASIKAHR